MVDCDTDAQRDLLARAKAIMSAPLQYHKEFPPNSLPEHGLSWISALPKPMSMLFNFWRKTVAGQFNQGLKGILGSPPQGGVSPESFLAVESVKGEWHKVLQAYDEYRKGKDAAEASQPDAAVGASASTDGACDDSLPGSLAGTDAADTVASFQRDCSSKAEDYLSQHFICIHDVENTYTAYLGRMRGLFFLVCLVWRREKAWILSRFCRRLRLTTTIQAVEVTRAAGRLMGFFDIKNCGLPRCYKGQSAFQRYPSFPDDALGLFVKTTNGLMDRRGHSHRIPSCMCLKTLSRITSHG